MYLYLCLVSDVFCAIFCVFCVPMKINILMLLPRVFGVFHGGGGNPFSRGECVESRNDCEFVLSF